MNLKNKLELAIKDKIEIKNIISNYKSISSTIIFSLSSIFIIIFKSINLEIIFWMLFLFSITKIFQNYKILRFIFIKYTKLNNIKNKNLSQINKKKDYLSLIIKNSVSQYLYLISSVFLIILFILNNKTIMISKFLKNATIIYLIYIIVLNLLFTPLKKDIIYNLPNNNRKLKTKIERVLFRIIIIFTAIFIYTPYLFILYVSIKLGLNLNINFIWLILSLILIIIMNLLIPQILLLIKSYNRLNKIIYNLKILLKDKSQKYNSEDIDYILIRENKNFLKINYYYTLTKDEYKTYKKYNPKILE